jgi:hypothetical protein
MKKNSSGNNAKLSIKSKLLFNNLDMLSKVVTDLNQSVDKRQKSIDKILSTYRMTVRPFVEDESSEYQDKLFEAINSFQNELNVMVVENSTVEAFLIKLNPVLTQMKGMISTCKVKMDEINALWRI